MSEAPFGAVRVTRSAMEEREDTIIYLNLMWAECPDVRGRQVLWEAIEAIQQKRHVREILP